MTRPREVTVHLRRIRYLPNHRDGQTVFVEVTYDGGLFGVLARLRPGQYPEFEGEEAWFRALQHPRKRFELLDQVGGRRG